MPDRTLRRIVPFVCGLQLCLGWGLIQAADQTSAGEVSPRSALRPAVHPRRNVDEFPPVRARFVRFTILKTSGAEPCIDELEIYSAGPGARNVALASAGAQVSGSGSLPGFKIHRVENINDGLYGNGHSWISNLRAGGWVMIELAELTWIDRVVWGRDREGRFIDRLATEYRIEAAAAPGEWRLVASSEDREPLKAGAEFSGVNPTARQAITRFAPVSTRISPEGGDSSHEYIIDAWQTEDGLPSNTIGAILQTRDGYLWVGTAHGLARFDGMRFEVFGEADGLPNSPILCLSQTRSGDLWIGTEGGGLVRLREGWFETFTTEDGLAHNAVLSLEEDSDGQLWIGTFSGLSRWRDGKLVPALPGDGRPFPQLCGGPGDRLYAIGGGELIWIEEGRSAVIPIPGEPSKSSSLFALTFGRSGDLWFGGANSYVARWCDGELGVFGEEYGAVPGEVWELHETANGDLWIGTGSGGLSRLRDGKFTTFTTLDGLSSNSIRCILEDREGNLWAGSNGGGLMRLKERKLTTYTTRDGLSHEVIMSLAQDSEGTIWIGSNCGGLNMRRDGEFSPAPVTYLLDNACIWSLLAASDGSLWIGTWGQGLFRKKGEAITNYLPGDGISDDIILALCEDRAGGLWIGTYEGGANYLLDGTFTRYGEEQGLSSEFVTCILEDREGFIWLGTSGGGLNRFNGEYFQVFSRRDGLGSDFIRTLYEDAEGVLWIGTGGGGLSRFKGGKFTTVTSRQGLKNDVISQIIEDSRGYFWFGSNAGIFRAARTELNQVLDGETPRLAPVSFGKSEGMESLECTGGFSPAGLRGRDGKLWFSTVKGLVMVDPAALPQNTNAPPVVIEEALVDGRSIWEAGHAAEAAGQPGREIQVPPGTKRVEFRFTALSLTAPEKIKFKYRLAGFENSWSEARGQRSAQYSGLPPGEYRFRVIASNGEGVWNEAGTSLKFSVLPAFWQTWWFLGLALAAGVALTVFLVHSLSVRKIQRRLRSLEQQHALERERARIARDLHDDIGSSLTQIAFLSDLGQRRRSRPGEVQTHLNQISKTAREVVRSVDQIVWAVNPKNDSLNHLVDYLSQFAEDFLAASGIRCRMEVPDHLPPLALSVEERHNVFLAAKEALHNVAKHSRASEVWIRSRVEPEFFIIQIEDNGIGFDPAARQAGGDGLNNMRQRVAAAGGELEIESGPGSGATIRLRVRASQTSGSAGTKNGHLARQPSK